MSVGHPAPTTTELSFAPIERQASLSDEHKAEVDHRDFLSQEVEAVRSAWDDLTYKQTARLFWKGSLVCFLAAFSAFTDGYQIAMVGNIIAFDGFVKQFSTANDPTTGAAILAPGVLSAWNAVGSVMQWCGMNFFPIISNRFGRKWCMIGYWLVIAAGCACETGARNWKVWLLAKMFVGLGVGAMQVTMQVYLTEMSPTSKVRGAMLSMYNFWWTTGLFIGTVVITLLHKQDAEDWLRVIYSEWSQVAVMGIIYAFLPESHWWHARQGHHEKGVKSMARINSNVPGYNAELEYAIVRRTVEHERAYALSVKEVPWLSIFKGVNGWRTFLSCYELTAAAFVGQSFLSTYVVYFFEIAGSTDAFANTCITSALGIVCTIFLIFGLDVVGRRRLITYGISLMWFSLLLIGCLSLVKNQNKAINGVLIFLACLWTICFNLANGAGWPLVGEVSSSRLRAQTAGFAASVSVAFGIGLGYGTPYMISTASLNWGLKTCFFFAGISAPLVIGLWFVIPETTGRSAAELDEMFEAKIKPWRFRKYVTEAQRVGTSKATGAQVEAASA
ncbi:uncharacterized protein I303_105690 [Kwoniella dejecticola CBS 10117]|uniref:Major facilitator superfamily (MFS) profile domain-containing protein n=1 Tax=Kwoniella dejecticola CBS 10117 TaxID=1296121 RepID=A0A1A6A048_9TREE|nr:uncharacterized protein I303_05712 [Kwoniella dejecticola CBS 10117]OBR83434.1 hypothetical protein I303_05712 [Kwoniella dejecticola CBS 10117]